MVGDTATEPLEERYDVIVVGSGGGLIGAFIAAARGLKTLLVEKTEHLGGTTAYSGGGIWLPGNPAILRAGVTDSPDAARPYLDAVVGDDSPAELRDAFLQAGPEVIGELEANPSFGAFTWGGVTDYFHEAPGSLKKGRTIFPRDLPRTALGDLEPLVRRPVWTERWGTDPGATMTGGQALIGRALLAFVGTGNGTVATETALEELVVEDGTVAGVVVDRDGDRVTIRADRGVLLAAGGFERNRELREKHQTLPFEDWTMGAPGNTGDALLAGQRVGADTALLDEAWLAPGIAVPGNRPAFYTAVRTGIYVNGAGKRFMNENLPYDRAGHEMLRLHTTTGTAHIPTHWVFDQRHIDNDAFGLLPTDPAVPGWFDLDEWLEAGAVTRADTLDELADLIGVPADALVATVTEFNEFAVTGVDEHFHRGEAPWDRAISSRTSADPTVVGAIPPIATPGPNRCLIPIDQPPYYAVEMVLTDLGTKGGLRTDGDGRVLRPDGSVIGGLYAAGNTMAPVTGRSYPGAGSPIASSMAFSYLAAVHMAAQDRTKP